MIQQMYHIVVLDRSDNKRSTYNRNMEGKDIFSTYRYGIWTENYFSYLYGCKYVYVGYE